MPTLEQRGTPPVIAIATVAASSRRGGRIRATSTSSVLAGEQGRALSTWMYSRSRSQRRIIRLEIIYSYAQT